MYIYVRTVRTLNDLINSCRLRAARDFEIRQKTCTFMITRA